MGQSISTLAGLTTAALLGAGCANLGPEMTDIPAQINYVCADNRQLPVARAPQQGLAAVLINNTEIILHRADSAAQEKYTNGNYTLYLDGEKAMLEYQSQVIFGPCISPVPLPTYIRLR